MQMIPKSELVELINNLESNIVSEDTCKFLFEEYGDEYYRDRGVSKWELCVVNEKRKKVFLYK